MWRHTIKTWGWRASLGPVSSWLIVWNCLKWGPQSNSSSGTTASQPVVKINLLKLKIKLSDENLPVFSPLLHWFSCYCRQIRLRCNSLLRVSPLIYLQRSMVVSWCHGVSISHYCNQCWPSLRLHHTTNQTQTPRHFSPVQRLRRRCVLYLVLVKALSIKLFRLFSVSSSDGWWFWRQSEADDCWYHHY